jgi:hypothetical protein
MQLKYSELNNFTSFSTSRRFTVKESSVFGDIMKHNTLKSTSEKLVNIQ